MAGLENAFNDFQTQQGIPQESDLLPMEQFDQELLNAEQQLPQVSDEDVINFDPTDALFISPDLTKADRDMASSVLLNTVKKMAPKKGLFKEVNEKEIATKINFAIKAVLEWKIKAKQLEDQ